VLHESDDFDLDLVVQELPLDLLIRQQDGKRIRQNMPIDLKSFSPKNIIIVDSL
jgi:hypothetical protein